MPHNGQRAANMYKYSANSRQTWCVVDKDREKKGLRVVKKICGQLWFSDMKTTADAGFLDVQVKICSTELLPTLLSGLTCSKLQEFTHRGAVNCRTGLIHTPWLMSSMARRMPRSKARASAGLWKVSPNFLSLILQWWKMGVTLLYTRSFCRTHSRTTWQNTNYRCVQSNVSHGICSLI